MSDMLEMLLHRRSIRNYTDESIPDEKLKTVLQAGLLSETGKNAQAWEFIVVQDRSRLEALAPCKAGSSRMIREAAAVIVVAVDSSKTDTWIDDAAIAMANMHLTADSIGLGSCYINARMRKAEDGRDSEAYIRAFFDLPETVRIVALLSLGIPAKTAEPHTLDQLKWSQVHWEQY